MLVFPSSDAYISPIVKTKTRRAPWGRPARTAAVTFEQAQRVRRNGEDDLLRHLAERPAPTCVQKVNEARV